MYEDYSNSIDEFLNKCDCDDRDLEKCDKCPAGEHEGIFCRCESRNMRIAKFLREKRKTPWESKDEFRKHMSEYFKSHGKEEPKDR